MLAEALVERVLGEGVQVLDRFPGAALDGVRYEPPFPFLSGREWGERGHTVLLADFVSADDGTGLVHTAIAFGEDDFRLGERYGLNVVNPVLPDGTYDERIGKYAGRYVKDADTDLIEDLKRRGRVLRAEELEHSYPHCWRSGNPLHLLREADLVHRDLDAARPPRGRQRGGQLAPGAHQARAVRRLAGGQRRLGALARALLGHAAAGLARRGRQRHGHRLLRRARGALGREGHRPAPPLRRRHHVPEPASRARPRAASPRSSTCGSTPGAMPFAQWHAPFENQEAFEEQYPADFVCEAIDQTRGWFYSLHAISVLLNDQPTYRNVVCLGLILDGEGQKMSKSKGNIVVPWDVIDRFGADAFRWYFFTSKQPWDGYRFSMDAIGEGVRLFLRQLWNVYAFYARYAPFGEQSDGGETDLDRWIRSRVGATVEEVTARLDDYDATFAGRAIGELVDDLSNWYVRRSRRRFWDGDASALRTLRETLVTVSQLLAPFTPFIADEIYENLDGSEPSVHLTDWPEPPSRDLELERDMRVAREAVTLGLRARAAAKVKLRQPLHEAVVVAAGVERDAIVRLEDVVRGELNVKGLRMVGAADELGDLELKPNYRSLGPRFGKSMPQVAAAVSALDASRVCRRAARGPPGRRERRRPRPRALGADDVIVSLAPLDGYQLEREGSHAVALELALDEGLRREGLAQEIVHAIQNARKATGLAVEDRIALTLGGDPGLLDVARAFEAHVAGETLAVEVVYDGDQWARRPASRAASCASASPASPASTLRCGYPHRKGAVSHRETCR